MGDLQKGLSDDVPERIEYPRHSYPLSDYLETLMVMGGGDGLLPLDNREGSPETTIPRRDVRPESLYLQPAPLLVPNVKNTDNCRKYV